MSVVMLDHPVPGSVVRSAWPVEPGPRDAGRLPIGADADAPANARFYTVWFLGNCRYLDPGTVEDARLIVSELVTNAVAATLAAGTGPAVIEVSLRLFADRLLIEVIDASPEPPAPRDAGPDAESGRGLHLVAALSRQWGYFACQGRKVVYCILPVPVPGGPQAEAPQAEAPGE